MIESDSRTSKGGLICRIRAGQGCFKVGGNCLKHLKREWNKKDGRGNKDFKEEGEGASWVKRWVPKKEKCNPLTKNDNVIHFRIITNFYISMYSVYY